MVHPLNTKDHLMNKDMPLFSTIALCATGTPTFLSCSIFVSVPFASSHEFKIVEVHHGDFALSERDEHDRGCHFGGHH